MSRRLLLHGGRVYDPANSVDGEVRDVYLEDGKVVAAFDRAPEVTRLDVSGMVVMPGGVDMHCHIAGPTINRARRLLPEEVQDERRGLIHSTYNTGLRYAALGYTTAVEAAVSASGARQAHFELEATPNLDRGLLLLLGNHEQVLETLVAQDTSKLQDLVAALLHKTGAWGIKIVNPGCVANWQRHGGDPKAVASIDHTIGSTSLTPRQILVSLAGAAEQHNLPHAVHIHANRLGMPGNVAVTLQTMQALQGRLHHLTHLQFHAYGDEQSFITSASDQLMSYINTHPEVTCDVGQVMFGPSLTVTEDSPLEYLLWQLTGRRWVNLDVELESGCGMMPFEFKETVTLHALQWAIGIELFLLAQDPWRVVLSTDHPNGASFLAYPRIIATLMDEPFRKEEMKRLPEGIRDRTLLKDLRREYSLSEIAIITRAGPARILGMRNKGHLGPGADADVTVYVEQANKEAMFSSPRFVIKGGEIVVREGQLQRPVPGKTLACNTPLEASGEALLRKWFTEKGSYAYEQFGISLRHAQTLVRPQVLGVG
jgi:formylmethanofuran dehydrogenase subunit A